MSVDTCQLCGKPMHDPTEVSLGVHADCYEQAQKLIEATDRFFERQMDAHQRAKIGERNFPDYMRGF